MQNRITKIFLSLTIILGINGCLNSDSSSNEDNWVDVTTMEQLTGTWINRIGGYESRVTYGLDSTYREVTTTPDTTQDVWGTFRIEPTKIFVIYSSFGIPNSQEFEYFNARIKDSSTLQYHLNYENNQLAILTFIRTQEK